jgi:hypothetical protein
MNLENNHPIHYEDILVIHNGHISNDNEIFKQENLHRNAEVDSEAIAALFQKYGIEKAHIPLGKLDGNFAVAVSDLRQPGTLVLAKGWTSPLYYYEAPEGIMWASEESVIIDSAKAALGIEIFRADVKMLSFGSLLLVQDGKVDKFDFDLYKEKTKTFTYSSKKKEDKWDDKEWEAKRAQWEKERKEAQELESDPAHIEFWENEPHEIAYTVKSGNFKFIFKKCDGCDKSLQTPYLTVTENGYIFCKSCLIDLANAEEVFEEDENPAVVHEVVIELVAEQYETNPDFVNWLLFESDDDDIGADGDTTLVSLYVQFSESYDKAYKELTGKDMGAAQRWADIAWEEKEDEEVFEDEE